MIFKFILAATVYVTLSVGLATLMQVTSVQPTDPSAKSSFQEAE